jgi:sugar phosphate isomerase/epimerase
MDPDALICAAHALGGYLNHRGLMLAERCRAARAGGFRRIGWALEDYRRERREGRSDADIVAILTDEGIEVAEIEFSKVGTVTSQDGTDWAAVREALAHLASVVKPRHLVCAVGLPGESGDHGAIVRDYRVLCGIAEDVGMLALLEAMPWSRISTIAAAGTIVAEADHPAGGIVLDTWHFHRVGGKPDDVRQLPAAFIRLIQISDAGPPVGDLFEDTVKRRLFPGEGGFALLDLLRAAAQHGVRAPVSVEVIGEVGDSLPVGEMARRSFVTTTALLEQSGFPAIP